MNDLADGRVLISLGLDAGLEPGNKLDVYRETGGGKYLGTLVVTKSVETKQAVCEFKPARAAAIEKLRPDELPRKGDSVGLLRGGVENPRLKPVPLLPEPPVPTAPAP
jgi:hypothetical protein